MYQPIQPKESTRLDPPTDLIALASAPDHIRKAVTSYILRKNMSTTFMPEMWYSDSRKRLILHIDGVMLGRDLTDASNQKWLAYHGGGQWLGDARDYSTVAVVTEDPFSFLKVRWAMPSVTAYAALGTRPRDGLVARLLRHQGGVVFFFDGDGPGWSGALAAAKRIRAFGRETVAYCAPWGKDPKDMQHAEIINHLQGAFAHGHTPNEKPAKSAALAGD
ncbi:putative DNA primase/helicase [Achromobacter phage vB_AxyP_19-32_Axy21]|uniref:Putative DNA primase/helicase n=1 Tax=Achromobacter phage vB_AxyP_19-32_Axy21 TaxID=2591045 RepID=A0A514CVP9_9CAUD|nr:putative DNA primase/helicase [Achromobacter phage vB_AxyP_19-32_Axy21]